MYTCICHIFIHSFIDGRFGCFHISTMVNNVTVQISFQIDIFVLFEYVYPEV